MQLLLYLSPHLAFFLIYFNSRTNILTKHCTFRLELRFLCVDIVSTCNTCLIWDGNKKANRENSFSLLDFYQIGEEIKIKSLWSLNFFVSSTIRYFFREESIIAAWEQAWIGEIDAMVISSYWLRKYNEGWGFIRSLTMSSSSRFCAHINTTIQPTIDFDSLEEEIKREIIYSVCPKLAYVCVCLLFEILFKIRVDNFLFLFQFSFILVSVCDQ